MSKTITVLSSRSWNKPNVWSFVITNKVLTQIRVFNVNSNETMICDFSDFPLHFTLLFGLVGVSEKMHCEGGTMKELKKAIFKYKLPNINVYQVSSCHRCRTPTSYRKYNIKNLGNMLNLAGYYESDHAIFSEYPDSVYFVMKKLDADLEIFKDRHPGKVKKILKSGNYVWDFVR